MMAMSAGGSSTRATAPKASKPAATAKAPKRQKGGTDHALKAASATYRATVAADVALDAQMQAASGKAENDRLEREGARICLRRRCVVQKAIRLPAVTLAGAAAKAEMLTAEIGAAKGMELSTDSAVLKLAASLAADVRRTAAAPATLAGLLASEDASADAELMELCAARPAAEAAYQAESGDNGPASIAFETLEDRIHAMKPHTLAGMLAKARVAKASALLPDGREDPTHCSAETLAWALLNDLLRLTGEGA